MIIDHQFVWGILFVLLSDKPMLIGLSLTCSWSVAYFNPSPAKKRKRHNAGINIQLIHASKSRKSSQPTPSAVFPTLLRLEFLMLKGWRGYLFAGCVHRCTCYAFRYTFIYVSFIGKMNIRSFNTRIHAVVYVLCMYTCSHICICRNTRTCIHIMYTYNIHIHISLSVHVWTHFGGLRLPVINSA
jgi:hypothetical protein